MSSNETNNGYFCESPDHSAADDAENEIMEILSKYNFTISNARWLFSVVLNHVESKNPITLGKSQNDKISDSLATISDALKTNRI